MSDLLSRHYEDASEAGRLAKSRVRRLEFATTLAAIERHAPRARRLLELGAGHGAYAFALARAGRDVVATDVVEANVEAMRMGAARAGLGVDVRRADGTQLHEFGDGEFHGVLCLGPIYHLRERALRERCLRECRRVVHEQGVVFVSYIQRAFAVPYLLSRGVSLSAAQQERLGERDLGASAFGDDFFDIAHFSLPAHAEEEAEDAGFRIAEHLGVDSVYGYFPAALEQLDEALHRQFVAHHLQGSARPEQRALSPHCLLVLRPR